MIPQAFEEGSGITVSMHFKSGDASLLDSFARNSFSAVHLNCSIDGLSNQFRRPFHENPSLFGDILQEVSEAVARETGHGHCIVSRVALSAFSAGYGAVQAILSQPESYRLVKTVFMLDTLYADWISDEVRVPRLEDVIDFMRFAQAAARRDKSLILTHADYDCDHAGYCSTRKTADLLLAAVGGSREPLHGSSPLSLTPTSECHVGDFHLFHFANRDHHSQLKLLPSLWTVYGLGGALKEER